VQKAVRNINQPVNSAKKQETTQPDYLVFHNLPENTKRMSDPTPISRARALRKNMTPCEKILWANLRKRKLGGFKFLRQHPVIYQVYNNKPLYFIADFYCAEKKLVIELDGKIHDFQKEEDKARDEIMTSQGLHVIRIRNEELENMRSVLHKITDYIGAIP